MSQETTPFLTFRELQVSPYSESSPLNAIQSGGGGGGGEGGCGSSS